MRALFLNENLGGHATVHANLRTGLAAFADVHADFVDVPPPGLARKALGYRVPGLARLDLDLQSLRFQLLASATARRRLLPVLPGHDVLHAYSHTVAWVLQDVLRSMPSVVATDATNEQNMQLRPYRRPALGTPLSSRPIAAIERRVLDAATLVVAQSEWAAGSLKAIGVPRDRVRLVRYGVPLPDRMPPRTSTSRPEFVFVGKTMERKGGHLLVDVFRNELRGRAVLHVVTQETVEGSDDVVVHADIRPGDGRLQEVLQRCTAFVLPSDTDMSPNAILEAMAAGLPVISTTTGAIPELVEHGVTGYLGLPRDRRGLLWALETLLSDPDGARAMGDAGFARASRHFDVRVTTADLVRVLAEARSRWTPRLRPSLAR